MKIRLYWIFAAAVCFMGGMLCQRYLLSSATTSDSANVVLASQPTPTPAKTEAYTQAKPEPTPVMKTDKVLTDDQKATAALVQHIREALASGNIADHDLVFAQLLPTLIKNHPAEAAQLAESLALNSSREEVMRCVARNWAAQDPTAAEKWAMQLSDQNERNETLGSVCFQIAQVDAREAVAVALDHDLGSAPGAVVENLVQQWAAQDFPGATSWVQQLPAGQQRDDMVSRLAFVQSQKSPAQAAQMVVEQIPPGPRQEEAAITVLYQWATRDIAGATAWVELFPPGALRDRAEKELAGIREAQQQHN